MNLKRLFCYIGLHLAIKFSDKGMMCEHCGYFKDRFEHQADLHAGQGGLL